MQPIYKPDTHTEAALYWSAVSLMVCEGLPMESAAQHLGVHHDDLRRILQRRATYSPYENLRAPAAVESQVPEYC